MVVHQGVLSHADEVHLQHSGSTRIIKYRLNDVAVVVPESGRCTWISDVTVREEGWKEPVKPSQVIESN